jgi:hypothetical protein
MKFRTNPNFSTQFFCMLLAFVSSVSSVSGMLKDLRPGSGGNSRSSLDSVASSVPSSVASSLSSSAPGSLSNSHELELTPREGDTHQISDLTAALSGLQIGAQPPRPSHGVSVTVADEPGRFTIEVADEPKDDKPVYCPYSSSVWLYLCSLISCHGGGIEGDEVAQDPTYCSKICTVLHDKLKMPYEKAKMIGCFLYEHRISVLWVITLALVIKESYAWQGLVKQLLTSIQGFLGKESANWQQMINDNSGSWRQLSEDQFGQLISVLRSLGNIPIGTNGFGGYFLNPNIPGGTPDGFNPVPTGLPGLPGAGGY